MKAIFVSPARKSVDLIDIGPDSDSWKARIGADRIDHQTLNLDPGLIAVVNDNGLSAGLPEYSIFAAVMNSRIFLAGDSLIFKSDDEQWLDATLSDIEWLDICF